MEPEGSWPQSQEPYICPCSELDDSRVCHILLFLKTVLLLFSHLSLSLKLSLPSGLPIRTLCEFLFSPQVFHASSTNYCSTLNSLGFLFEHFTTPVIWRRVLGGNGFAIHFNVCNILFVAFRLPKRWGKALLLLLLLLLVAFVQGIYTYIPETNNVFGAYSVGLQLFRSCNLWYM